jgi:hypothetical protein
MQSQARFRSQTTGALPAIGRSFQELPGPLNRAIAGRARGPRSLPDGGGRRLGWGLQRLTPACHTTWMSDLGEEVAHADRIVPAQAPCVAWSRCGLP